MLIRHRSTHGAHALRGEIHLINQNMQYTEAHKNTIEFGDGSYFYLWEALIRKEGNELSLAELLVFRCIKMIEKSIFSRRINIIK